MSGLTASQIEARAQLARAGIGVITDMSWIGDPATAAAVTAAATGRPAPVLEPADPVYFGRDSFGIQIDRFSANPAVSYLRQAMAGHDFPTPAPSFFRTGDLPLITGSGVDPQVLAFIDWRVRHAAAFTTSRARVLKLIEESDGADTTGLQSSDGRHALNEYLGRCRAWALDTGDQELSEEDFDSIFAPR